MVDTALDLFKRRQSAGRATVLVFYRAERSFFCKQWLRRWLSIPGFDRRLDLADVFLLFVSSQSQGKAYSVADQIAGKKSILDTRVFFFGDPEHLLVDYLAETGFAHPVVTNPESHRAHGWVFDYGMVQPAVLALASDDSVLYEWTSKPSLLNVAGFLDRPEPWDVWDKIEQRIDRIRITKARAARRAIAASSSIAAGSSNASAIKDGSTISSEGPSKVQTQKAYRSQLAAVRSTIKESKPAKGTQQSSTRSFGSSSQLPGTRPESPVLTESPEKEPKSTDEDREDKTKSALVFAPHAEGESSANDWFSSTGGDRKYSRAGSDGDVTTAPPSTAIDTLTVDASLKASLSREERDNSEDDMPNMRVQQFTASLNALASEVLGDRNLSLVEPEPETVAKLPRIAEKVVLSQHRPNALRDAETKLEVAEENKRGTCINDVVEGKQKALHSDNFMRMASNTTGTDVREGTTFSETEQDVLDDGKSRFDVRAAHSMECEKKETPLKSMTMDKVEAANPELPKTELLAKKPTEANAVAAFPIPSKSLSADPVTARPITSQHDLVTAVQNNAKIPDPTKAKFPELERIETGSTKVGVQLDQAMEGATEATSHPVKKEATLHTAPRTTVTPEMESSTSDEVVEFVTSTSKEATASTSFETTRTSDMFDTQGSIGDTLETSAASLGSDQVDSTAIIIKHPSVRTEDSAQINSLAGFEGSSFPSERRIPEEADDKKTGISDYLKELKDPSKLKDPRYRSRHDPLPPIKSTGRSAVVNAIDSLPRPSSVSGYSFQKGPNLGASGGLAQDLIQQETGMSAASSARDSIRRGRESRVSQRIAPPVAVFVADTELETPPRLPKTSSARGAEQMTASPHPEVHNLSRTGTVDISPFADADHEYRVPENLRTKSSLRDEYEAYDEYIVCEYEVEEYVEEYESDTFSKSKVFVTAVVDDSSQDGSMYTASEGRTPNEVHHFDHCNVVDVKGTARGAGADGRVRVWKENGARQTEAISPTTELNSPNRESDTQPLSPVQTLLRKMGVRSTRRTRFADETTPLEEPTHSLPRDPSRISRKDTLRSVLRKTPRQRMTPVEPEETADQEEDEAKLRRKETIKSVLRKIPVPKNLKRAQTEVAIGDDNVEEHPTSPGEDNVRHSKRNGLQAVLQRLPSLSSANRHRGGVKIDTATQTTQPKESSRIANQTRVTQEAGDRNTAPMTAQVAGAERPGVFQRTFSRLAQSEDSVEDTVTAPGQDGDATAGSSVAPAVTVSSALGGKKKVRWDEEGEKVGAKMSFAVVGGRILSKFKV